MSSEERFRPQLLDLFCGGGGASMGYHRAGFDVTGVDNIAQPDYPFAFHLADALTFPLDGYDVVAASPPCESYTRAGHLRAAQGRANRNPDLLVPVIERLREWGGPFVVENVPGAPWPRDLAVMFLCGSAFGLRVRRHREFGSNVLLLGEECQHRTQGRPVGVYYRPGDEIPGGGRTAVDLADGRDAIGIDWLPWSRLIKAIPPAYTEHLGVQLLDYLAVAA